jgi:hypothetical protein
MNTCEWCNNEYEKKQYSQRFCSTQCRIDWHNKSNRELIKEAKDAKKTK